MAGEFCEPISVPTARLDVSSCSAKWHPRAREPAARGLEAATAEQAENEGRVSIMLDPSVISMDAIRAREGQLISVEVLEE